MKLKGKDQYIRECRCGTWATTKNVNEHKVFRSCPSCGGIMYLTVNDPAKHIETGRKVPIDTCPQRVAK